MSPGQNNDFSAEWLAAYADGELDRNAALAPMKRQVEDWLAEHPEARTDVEEQRRLHELFEQTGPPEPEPPAWAEIMRHLEQAPRELDRRQALSWRRLAGILAVTAAAIWLTAFLTRPPDRDSGPEPATRTSATEEPFAVATADEIEILSVEGDEVKGLVVGEAPVREALELLQPGEMTVISMDSAAQNNVRLDLRGTALPMVWALLDSER